MNHIAITYRPTTRQWETLRVVGARRHVLHVGTQAACITRARRDVTGFPVFLFDKTGESCVKIKA